MNDKMVFGQYYPINSWVHRLDPRAKLLSVLILMISVFLIDSIYILLGFLGILFIIVISTRIPIGKFINSFKMMSFVLVLTFIIQILFRKDGDLLITFNFQLTYFSLMIIVVTLLLWLLVSKYIKYFKLLIFLIVLGGLMALQYYTNIWGHIVSYHIDIYSRGLVMGSYVVLRLLGVLVISSLLTFSTKPTELNNGLDRLLSPLKKIGIKISILSMMISIALRFIPTLSLEADKILKAQASRGADFKEGSLKQRIGQIVALIVPMFIISYKRAYDLADAMEARGYIPDNDRTSIYVLKYRFSDVLTLLFDFLVLGLTIFLKVAYAI